MGNEQSPITASDQVILLYILTGERKLLKRVKRKKASTTCAFTHSYKPEVLRCEPRKKRRNRHIYPIAKDHTDKVFRDGQHKRHKPANAGFGEAGKYVGARVMRAQTERKVVTFNHTDPSCWFGNPHKAPYEPHGHICKHPKK